MGVEGGAELPDEIPAIILDVWTIVLDVDDAGKRELKDKAWRNAKKAEKKAKKDKKGKKKRRHSDSSSSSSSSSSSTSSSSSSSSSSSGKKKRKGKGKGKGKERARAGGGEAEFKVVGGERHFCDRAGNLDKWRPPPPHCLQILRRPSLVLGREGPRLLGGEVTGRDGGGAWVGDGQV